MKFRDVFILSLILGLSVFVGGFTKIGKQIKAKLMPPIEVVSISEVKGELRDFFLEDDHLEGLVNRWYDRLSLEAQVGQLIMPALDATLNDDALKLLIESETVGGFMVLTKDFSEASLKALEEANPNQVPLLVSVDAEPSLLKYRFTDPVYEKETADLKTAERITEVSRLIATELKRFGMNLNFAPVYDLSTNTTVIGTRAFSGTSAEVQSRANLMSQTFMSVNIIPTAKHFPGHGLVAGDTHLELQTITEPLTELPQFKAAINDQIPVVMVGHLAVKNDTYDTEGLPATLSPLMMQDLLRNEMGFEGVIITDAMNMQAVSAFENADLLSLLAGADIVLMPADAGQLNRDIQTLLMAEPVFQAEIEAKIKRVLRLKLVWRLSQY